MSVTYLEELLRKVRIVVSEIDGVITDGKVNIIETGLQIQKNFSIKDLEIINKIKKTHRFAFMSSNNSINYTLCAHRNIPFFWAETNKVATLNKILQRYGFSVDNVLYVGANPTDLEVVKYVPLSMCPDDAVEMVKKYCIHRLAPGGTGTLCCVYDILSAIRYEVAE